MNVRAFRRALLQRGLTRLPVCPVCGLQKEPTAFVFGRCRDCDRVIAEDYAARFRGADGSTHYPESDYRSKDDTPF